MTPRLYIRPQEWPHSYRADLSVWTSQHKNIHKRGL